MMGLLFRNENFLKSRKITNTYDCKKNKIILDKLNSSLPELMNRNQILGERLKNKIKVSSFMNNAEHKNRKYFKYFIFYAGRRVRDLKTGLTLKRVMEKGTDHLTPVCKHINNDIIIKHGDFLLNEKQLIKEATEQETHIKINEIIKDINDMIKNKKIEEKPVSNRIIKSVSEEELDKIKNVINSKLNEDEKQINDKINYYINRLNIIAESQPREFHRVAHHMYINNNIKMIEYTKPKTFSIKDSESANMIRIRNHLMQNIPYQKKDMKIIDSNNKENDKDFEMTNIRKYMNKRFTNSINKNHDTLNVLKHLVYENNYLSKKAKKNLKKINSLIDIKLPYCSNYYRAIKYNKNKSMKRNFSMDNLLSNKQKLAKIGFKGENALDKIKLIKDEINKIKDIKKDIKVFKGFNNLEK